MVCAPSQSISDSQGDGPTRISSLNDGDDFDDYQDDDTAFMDVRICVVLWPPYLYMYMYMYVNLSGDIVA